MGEEVRWSILAGVLALLGRHLGVDGLPRVDGGFGEAAGLGEAVLPLGVAGDDGRCLDKGLGLEERKIEQKNVMILYYFAPCWTHYYCRPGLKCLFKMIRIQKKPDLRKQVHTRQNTQTLHHLKVHYRSASQQHGGEASIVLKKTFIPLGLTALQSSLVPFC